MTTSEARKDLSRVVRQVRGGQRVILSRHNKPAAVLISIAELRRFRALESLNDSSSTHQIADGAEDISWEDLKAELGD